MRDVTDACDLLRPVWERTEGRDGYVSSEVDPNLAGDAVGTIAQATRFHEEIARSNLLVKIPATAAGPAAIKEMIARRELFQGERWQALAARGATPQRYLWASTSVK